MSKKNKNTDPATTPATTAADGAPKKGGRKPDSPETKSRKAVIRGLNELTGYEAFYDPALWAELDPSVCVKIMGTMNAVVKQLQGTKADYQARLDSLAQLDAIAPVAASVQG